MKNLSLSSWERGLKSYYINSIHQPIFVALFMGAWIEIFNERRTLITPNRRSLHGSVDWNPFASTTSSTVFFVALFMGAWIEIIVKLSITESLWCRSLHGSVDWNKHSLFIVFIILVALFMGAWIEIILLDSKYYRLCVALFMGAWIEIWLMIQKTQTQTVALFMGAWIEIQIFKNGDGTLKSLSSWERGLK